MFLDTLEARINVGGAGAAIYYINMDISSSEDTTSIIAVPFDVVKEGHPREGDLLINEDGKFLKVLSVNENINTFTCKIIAVSGTGSDGPGSSITQILVKNIEGNEIKYFSTDAPEAFLKFEVKQLREGDDNEIATITYTIGSEIVATQKDQPFQEFEFDIAPYFHLMSRTGGTTVRIKATDIYGSSSYIDYTIHAIELTIAPASATYNKSIFYWYNDAGNTAFQYNVKVGGSVNLDNRKIVYHILDSVTKKQKLEITKSSTSNNTSNLIEFEELRNTEKFPHGIYYLEAYLQGNIPGTDPEDEKNILTSQKLLSQIICYDSSQNDQILAVSQKTATAMQYEKYAVEYMIGGNVNSLVQEAKVTWQIGKTTGNDLSKETYANINTLQEFSIYFTDIATHSFSVLINDDNNTEQLLTPITVIKYEGNMPVIEEKTSMVLNLTALNKTNNDVNKDSWTYKDIYTTFNNVQWNNVSGWKEDTENQTSYLHLANGAEMQIENFYPFKTDIASGNSIGYTIELDFRISNVTDFTQPLITCLGYTDAGTIKSGFQITGQESTMNTVNFKATGSSLNDDDENEYNTMLQGLTAKFMTDERFHLTWVIESAAKVVADNSLAKPLITTYINGIPVGMTYYELTDAIQAADAQFKVNSTYGHIDIYNIRAYREALQYEEVLKNYIATCGSSEKKINKFNLNDIVDENGKLNINPPNDTESKLTIPYMKLTGGFSLHEEEKWNITNSRDENNNIIYRLPQTKKDYRLMECIYIDPNNPENNFTETMEVKHTETNEKITDIANVPADDLKDLKWKTSSGCRVYGQGTSSMEYPVKNLRIKFKNHKYVAYKNAYPVDLVCCKADYMESSGSHNTGTANVVDNLMSLNASKLQSPAQTFQTTHKDYANGKDLVTNIKGHPIIIFWRATENDDYEFIGKYNLNLDKATPEPFGFINYPEEAPEAITDDTFGWAEVANEDGTKTIKNAIHCYEVLNNSDNLVTFRSSDDFSDIDDRAERFSKSFFELKANDKGEMLPRWSFAFESRYPEQPDPVGSTIDVDIQPFFRLCDWLNSTEGNPEKFKAEYKDYLDENFTIFYYIITHLLLMMDSRAKNMMLATWDNTIWYPIFYDMDTALGLNNYGYNKYGFDTEDTTPNVYNGSLSILWNNVRLALSDKIAVMFNQLTGLDYTTLINMYGLDQADAWNEIIYNLDAQYKYVRPLAEGFYGDGAWVGPYVANYLYAAQGSRSMHRRWWLSNRFNYFNGKYVSDDYKRDRFVMRLYSPDENLDAGSIYISLGILNQNQYEIEQQKWQILYKKVLENDEYRFIEVNIWETNTEYYYKNTLEAAEIEKIQASIQAVPVSHNYNITPFQNSYLAVAYGGDNGTTVGPQLALAGQASTIYSPTGMVFNDTETYVYGGSLLQDLGDLSNKYLGKFEVPNSPSRLTHLILGNPHNDYYNPNFSQLNIGSNLPYLTTLNLMNCVAINSVDLSNCHQISSVLATGSRLTSITLPEGSQIQELRLPSTITNLSLINQTQLQNDLFTIGTHTYNNNNKTITYNLALDNLSYLTIINSPLINSYLLAKAPLLEYFYLPEVNWEITDIEDVVIENNELVSLKVLDDLAAKSPLQVSTIAQALTGTITINVADIGIKAIDIYNKYIETYPHIIFKYGNNIDQDKYTPAWRIGFVDIQTDEIVWERYISDGEALGDISEEEYAPLPYFSKGQYDWTFTDKWYLNDNKDVTYTREEIINISSVTEDMIFTPVYSTTIKQCTLIVYKEKNSNEIIYTETVDYGTYFSDLPYYLYKPYLEDALNEGTINFYSRWRHNGFTDGTTNYNKLSDILASLTNYEVYATYVVEDCRYIPTDSKFFTAIIDNESNTCTLTPVQISADNVNNINYYLQGKITIPEFYIYNNKKYEVTGISSFSVRVNNSIRNPMLGHYITHVFFENNNARSNFTIEKECFNNLNVNLVYIDLTYDYLTQIEYLGCRGCTKLINTVIGGSRLQSISTDAFRGVYQADQGRKSGDVITISGSVSQIGSGAFSYCSNISEIIIGRVGNPTKLNFVDENNFQQLTSFPTFSYSKLSSGTLANKPYGITVLKGEDDYHVGIILYLGSSNHGLGSLKITIYCKEEELSAYSENYKYLISWQDEEAKLIFIDGAETNTNGLSSMSYIPEVITNIITTN